MKLFKWLARNIFHIIGGFLIAAGVPIGKVTVLGNQLLDAFIFIPIGVTLAAISWYYTFIDKS